MARRRRIDPKLLALSAAVQAPPPGGARPPRAAREADAAAPAQAQPQSRATAGPPPGDGAVRVPRAPIAHLAGEAAAEQDREIARLQAAAEEAGQLADARADGRLLVDVPLDEIDIGYLKRDRIVSAGRTEDEDDRALRESIAVHGQRVPVDLVAYGPEEARARAPFRYGLISGFRRIRALRVLRDSGRGILEREFATARAILRTPADLGFAYLAMVEENELRTGLSYYERGRIAALAHRQGAYGSAESAVDALFAAGSRARRSKIRSFLAIFHAFEDELAYPTMLTERDGLALAGALKRHGGPALVAAFRRQPDRGNGPEAELAALRAAAAALDGTPPPRPPAPVETVDLGQGRTLERRSGRHGTELRVRGLDGRAAAEVEAALRKALGSG